MQHVPRQESADYEQRYADDTQRTSILSRYHGSGSLLSAFRHAFDGLWYLFTTQRNAQIHLLISAIVVTLGAALGLERWEWLVLVLTIALVLAFEGINTAIEATVDLVTNKYHPLARTAKDVSAGAVVLCAVAAVVVGSIVFLPHLWVVVAGLLGW